VGEWFGRRIFELDRKRRERAIDNLMMAFPEMEADQAAQIAREVFLTFGRAGADFLAGGLDTWEQICALTEARGLEHFDSAWAQGKGVILMTGHFGCFERAARFAALRGHPITVIAREANQDAVTGMVAGLRAVAGLSIAPRGRPIAAMRALRQGHAVGVLADQNAEGPHLPFFGQPAATALGPGVMQRRSGAPALPMLAIQLPGRRCLLECHPPLEPGEDVDGEGSGLMRAYNSWLEAQIRRRPEQWLWMHDRWKAGRLRQPRR
jgi:KDO2-lipid IV(A) lauroyltransferase